jgi:hypothetical protein
MRRENAFRVIKTEHFLSDVDRNEEAGYSSNGDGVDKTKETGYYCNNDGVNKSEETGCN